MNGFCTRSMLLMTTLFLIVFSNNFSASLYSDEVAVNGTRLYCLSDGIEDQWLGILPLVVFLPGYGLADDTLPDLQQKKVQS